MFCTISLSIFNIPFSLGSGLSFWYAVSFVFLLTSSHSVFSLSGNWNYVFVIRFGSGRSSAWSILTLWFSLADQPHSDYCLKATYSVHVCCTHSTNGRKWDSSLNNSGIVTLTDLLSIYFYWFHLSFLLHRSYRLTMLPPH